MIHILPRLSWFTQSSVETTRWKYTKMEWNMPELSCDPKQTLSSECNKRSNNLILCVIYLSNLVYVFSLTVPKCPMRCVDLITTPFKKNFQLQNIVEKYEQQQQQQRPQKQQQQHQQQQQQPQRPQMQRTSGKYCWQIYNWCVLILSLPRKGPAYGH